MHLRLASPGAVIVAVGCALGTAAVLAGWSSGARSLIIAGTCLLLWLGQLVPVWTPTLVLWAGATLLLPDSSGITPGYVLTWFADPVLLLFIGGFALATAAERHGADAALATLTREASDRSRRNCRRRGSSWERTARARERTARTCMVVPSRKTTSDS